MLYECLITFSKDEVEVDRVLETLMRRVWIPRRTVGLNTNQQLRAFLKHPTIPRYIWVFIWSIMLPPHHLYLPDGPYQVYNFSGVYKIPFIFVRLRPSPTQNTVARWSRSLQPVTLPEPPPQQLHWSRYRIDHKILLLTLKALHNPAPQHLSELLCLFTPFRSFFCRLAHYTICPFGYPGVWSLWILSRPSDPD